MMPPEMPRPDRDTNWMEFPNEWDLEMMEWREELELYAKELRAQFFAVFEANQPIPLADYTDGKIEFKWDGKVHPVSKRYYHWIHRTNLLKRDDAPMFLAHVMSTRARASAKAS